ncbi:unnamed protein product [Linum trigynum]|uniref:Uncharacterized protein n=1 Tax=Linum trigynum TaxID=586398 RepID=A0AAV2C9Z8_9ROSI
MGRHRDGSVSERDELEEDRKSKSRARGNDDVDSPDAGDRKSDGKHRRKRLAEDSSDSDSGKERKRRRSRKHSGKRESRKRRSDESDSEYSDSEESESSESLTEESESEEERKRRKRREKRKRKEREEEKEKKRRRKEKEKKKRKEKRKKEKAEIGKRGAVTNLWGKYGIIRETDMWNKRPEFSAWLSEVKQVNLETLPNWEEKQMFKQFMEDHNTATFPSKKYYDLDAYYKRQMLKELKSGKKVQETERTMFNDEELKRQEQMREREKQKEKEVEALKLSMQSGMAQAMKDQALLREEMAYQYKIGNYEAAAAIQRKLEPDPI